MPGLLTAEPSQLKAARTWTFTPGAPDPSGRITIFERPVPGGTYVVGADFAHGVGRDWDTACIYSKDQHRQNGKSVQVAEAQGQWGVRFGPVLYALLMYYNGAFLLGERQGGGTHVMRWLWDYCDYRWMYRTGDATKAVAVSTDANPGLGWARGANDVVLASFRMACAQGRVVIRSARTLEQMASMQFKARTNDEMNREPDERLRLTLPGGGSPDLTMAAAYGHYALSQVTMFDRPAPGPGPGTYAHDLGIGSMLTEHGAGWKPLGMGVVR